MLAQSSWIDRQIATMHLPFGDVRRNTRTYSVHGRWGKAWPHPLKDCHRVIGDQAVQSLPRTSAKDHSNLTFQAAARRLEPPHRGPGSRRSDTPKPGKIRPVVGDEGRFPERPGPQRFHRESQGPSDSSEPGSLAALAACGSRLRPIGCASQQVPKYRPTLFCCSRPCPEDVSRMSLFI